MKKIILLSMLVALALSGCHSKQAEGPPAVEVTVATIHPQRVTVNAELPGRVSAVRTAQVRARVAGILLEQTVQGGRDVKAGEILFKIDAAPLQASYNSAKANLEKAIANQFQSHSKASRYKSLDKGHYISKQEYIDIVAQAQQADADVAVAKAALETAQLNLNFASVTAPISGRVGTPQVTEGALVGQNETTLLTTIQQLDPIFVDMTQSSADILRLKSALSKQTQEKFNSTGVEVDAILEDGTLYPLRGKLLFSDVSVDPSTGMVTLRAEFPNPEQVLLPGMFVRAKFAQAVNEQGILILQRTVMRQADGTAAVWVVDANNKAVLRPVTLGEAVDNNWVVISGLKVGERVIVEGLQKVQPDALVKPLPFVEQSKEASPKGGAHG